MSTRRVAAVALAALLLVALPARAGARGLPDWLAAAVRDTSAAGAGDAPALDLLREQSVALDARGTVTRVVRRVTRVRGTDGRPWAVDAVGYLQGTSRVLEARAWRVPAGGAPLERGRDRVVDRAEDVTSLYSEARTQALDLRDEVEAGDLVAWEWRLEERGMFRQDLWVAQGELPVAVSRYALRLPAGWASRVTALRGAAPEVREAPEGRVWELRALPDLRDEDGAPPFEARPATFGIDWLAPADARGVPPAFEDWRAVGGWLTGLAAAADGSDDEVRARAAALTRGCADDLARLRAIGRFVQEQPYAALSLGLARGNGYVPRPAPRVLQQGFGDCKDKSNLVRVLLREAGLRAWLVAARAGHADRVDERWPSPFAFDHCIVAVAAPWARGFEAAVEHPALGTLLLFDPTDPLTPVGAVPPGLAGGTALLQAGDSSAMLRVPGRDTSWVLDRDVHATLGADGSVRAVVHERSSGREAWQERRLHRQGTSEDYQRTLEAWVSRGVNGARVTAVRVRDEHDSTAFDLTVELAAERYATRVGDRLLTLRPALVSRRVRAGVSPGPRRLPVRLAATAWRERTTWMLPAGCVPDELPPPVALDSPFGRYAWSCVLRSGRLECERSLTLTAADVPAALAGELRAFLERVRAADQALAVLELRAP